MNPATRRTILLVPDDSLFLAFRLPRILRDAGCDVDLLCLPDELMIRSRHIRTAFPEGTHDAIFRRLLEILRDPARPWQKVVVANEAIARRLFASGDTAALANWQPGAAEPLWRSFFVDKLGLASVWEAGVLPVPPGRACACLREVEEFAHEHGWPIIVKPPHGAGGCGVMKVDGPRELRAQAAALAFPILAQKFIRGVRGVADMFTADGRALAWLTSYSTRQYSGEFSSSTARHFQAMPEIRPLIAQVARLTRFEGFCGFDWIREEETGRHWLVEFHPRAPSGFRFGRFCGVSFPAAIEAWLDGSAYSFPPQVQPPGKGVRAHYFTSDLIRCVRRRDWAGLRAWLPGSGARHDVFWDDLPLMFAWAVRRLWRRFRPPATRSRAQQGEKVTAKHE